MFFFNLGTRHKQRVPILSQDTSNSHLQFDHNFVWLGSGSTAWHLYQHYWLLPIVFIKNKIRKHAKICYDPLSLCHISRTIITAGEDCPPFKVETQRSATVAELQEGRDSCYEERSNAFQSIHVKSFSTASSSTWHMERRNCRSFILSPTDPSAAISEDNLSLYLVQIQITVRRAGLSIS